METLTPTVRKTIREKQPISSGIWMMREIMLLLAIAGAAYALEPAILLTEQPRMLLQPDGTREYWLEYVLAVSNPSERNELRFFIANYSLPPGFMLSLLA